MSRIMTLGVRHVAVAITVILHAVSGILLSVLFLCLQLLVPSLKQLPPSFDHISNPADPPKQHFLSRRDSGYSVHSVTSESVSSDESYETPSSTPEPDPKDSLEKRATMLLASQARARAARPSLFSLSDSLWTLKEYPSPPMPSQLGGERGAATILSDIPHDILSDSPSSASLRFSTPPQEEHEPGASTPPLKRPRSNHCLSRIPLPRKAPHALSLPLPGLSRHKSSSSPHLREVAKLSRNESHGDGYNHRRSSVSGHVRKIVGITPVPKCKGRKRKVEKNRPSETGLRVDHGRTDPYQAPYFFPSPVSPWAHEYTRLARLDRKLVLDADVPASSSAPIQSEVDRSWPGERMRSMWAPLHRRGVSPGSDSWP